MKAALSMAIILADTIRELKEVPEGHLYAHIMNHLSLDQFDGRMRLLVNAGVIKISNHLITWTGPEKV